MLGASLNCSIFGTAIFANFYKKPLYVKSRGGSLVVECNGNLPFARWLMHKAPRTKDQGAYVLHVLQEVSEWAIVDSNH